MRSVVARNEQRARLRVCATTARPPPPSRPRLRRRLPSPGAGLPGAVPWSTLPSAATSSSCSPVCSASCDTSSRSLSAGAGSSASFGASAARSRAGIGGRLAQRHRPAPRGAADEPRPERELSRRPPRAFRSGEQAVEQHPEPSPERQLAGRLLPGTRASRAGRQPAVVAAHPPVLLSPRQAPGAPAVRPQSFGNGGTRQPGKLSDRANSQLLQLLVAVALERQQRAAAAARGTSACGRRRRSAPAPAARRSPRRAPRSAARPPRAGVPDRADRASARLSAGSRPP